MSAILRYENEVNIMDKNILKVVLHVSNNDQIARMQSNINNLLKEDNTIQVNVVINGEAVTRFIKGSDLALNPKATYFLCNNSLNAHYIAQNGILNGTQVTSSGVYKLALLQKEGFLYIKV